MNMKGPSSAERPPLGSVFKLLRTFNTETVTTETTECREAEEKTKSL